MGSQGESFANYGRIAEIPCIPSVLENLASLELIRSDVQDKHTSKYVRRMFPGLFQKDIFDLRNFSCKQAGEAMNIGVLFTGGPAPGMHNIISGLWSGIKQINSSSRLIGFLDGFEGVLSKKWTDISLPMQERYLNLGGCHMLGTSRFRLDPSSIPIINQSCQELKLSALIVVGGYEFMHDTALLADQFSQVGSPVSIIGIPKTIDGDIVNKYLKVPLGFHTATRTFAGLLGDLMCDAISSNNYYHFVKLMGGHTSHVVLEVALYCRPNLALILEEERRNNSTLEQISDRVRNLVTKRVSNGLNHGIVLVPEGLLEGIPEIRKLVSEIKRVLQDPVDRPEFNRLSTLKDKVNYLLWDLSLSSKQCLASLPKPIVEQLIQAAENDDLKITHWSNPEKLLARRTFLNGEASLFGEDHPPHEFKAVTHFWGYEGRSAAPSEFDSSYGFTLGLTGALLANGGMNGYFPGIPNLESRVIDWLPRAVPLTKLLDGHSESFLSIESNEVDLNGYLFQQFREHREEWVLSDKYAYPGSLQYGSNQFLEVPQILRIQPDKQ